MKHTYIHLAGFASVLVLLTGTSVVFAETSAGTGSSIPAPVMMKVDAEGKMEVGGEMPIQPVVKSPTLETSGKGNVMMKPMEDGVETDEMEMPHDGKPMEMNVDANGRMEMRVRGDRPEGGDLEEEEYKDADLDVDVESLMKAEAKEDHTHDVEITEATEVHSKDDFEHLVAHKAKTDEHIKQVEVKGGKVEVTYELPVKFLGFWGTTLDTTMSADAEGNVAFDYPWYAVFMKKEFSKNTVEPVLKEELTEAKAGTTATAGATSTPSVKRTFAAPHVFEALLKATTKIRGGWDIKANTR